VFEGRRDQGSNLPSGVLAVNQKAVPLLQQFCEIRIVQSLQNRESQREFAPVRQSHGVILEVNPLTGQFVLLSVTRSPMSIDKPPSPDIEMTWRPEIGSPFATE